MPDPVDPNAPPPPPADPKPAEKPAEPLLPQSKVNALLAAERRAAAEKIAAADALTAELEALKAEKQAAEEAKLTAAQRLELERKREREAFEKERATLNATATRERTARHDLLRRNHAASAVAKVAARLHSPDLVPHLESTIASRLVIEADPATGADRVMIRMSDAAADLEPVESGLGKYLDASIAPAFFKAQGGSGAQHGGGIGGGNAAWKSLPPEERIKAGLGAK
jgi:hypothetical protein